MLRFVDIAHGDGSVCAEKNAEIKVTKLIHLNLFVNLEAIELIKKLLISRRRVPGQVSNTHIEKFIISNEILILRK